VDHSEDTVCRNDQLQHFKDMNATFAVENPKQVFEVYGNDERPFRPIPRNVSTYCEIQNHTNEDSELERDLEGMIDEDFSGEDDEFDNFFESVEKTRSKPRVSQSGRPRGARKRYERRALEMVNSTKGVEPNEEPGTPYVSEGSATPGEAVVVNETDKVDQENIVSSSTLEKSIKHVEHPKEVDRLNEGHKAKQRHSQVRGPKTSTPKSSPASPRRNNAVERKRSLDKHELSYENKTTKGKKSEGRVGRVIDPKIDGRHGKFEEERGKHMEEKKKKIKDSIHRNKESFSVGSPDGDNHRNVRHNLKERAKGKKKSKEQEDIRTVGDDSVSEQEKTPKGHTGKKYTNEDYAHDKVKKGRSGVNHAGIKNSEKYSSDEFAHDKIKKSKSRENHSEHKNSKCDNVSAQDLEKMQRKSYTSIQEQLQVTLRVTLCMVVSYYVNFV